MTNVRHNRLKPAFSSRIFRRRGRQITGAGTKDARPPQGMADGSASANSRRNEHAKRGTPWCRSSRLSFYESRDDDSLEAEVEERELLQPRAQESGAARTEQVEGNRYYKTRSGRVVRPPERFQALAVQFCESV